MSQSTISAMLRSAVADHFEHRCCYCLTSERIVGAEFTIDHIVPQSLGGASTEENLCLACWRCNLLKRDQITGADPATGIVVRLFNPRSQNWYEHFAWQQDGLVIVGLTAIGRATVKALRLNRATLLDARRLWIDAGWHPPQQ
jgi:hypothetical protein